MKKMFIGAIEKLASAMKKNKKLEIAVFAIPVIICAVLFISTLIDRGDGDAESAGDDVAAVRTEADDGAEARLEEALSCIRGAGRVKVMITYETGVTIVPAMSSDITTSSATNESDSSSGITENRTESTEPAIGADGTIVLTEKQPEVRGVIVIAEGAGNISVRLALMSACETVLGIDADKVQVFEMTALAEG